MDRVSWHRRLMARQSCLQLSLRVTASTSSGSRCWLASTYDLGIQGALSCPIPLPFGMLQPGATLSHLQVSTVGRDSLTDALPYAVRRAWLV